jgi:hypothetical protein
LKLEAELLAAKSAVDDLTAQLQNLTVERSEAATIDKSVADRLDFEWRDRISDLHGQILEAKRMEDEFVKGLTQAILASSTNFANLTSAYEFLERQNSSLKFTLEYISRSFIERSVLETRPTLFLQNLSDWMVKTANESGSLAIAGTSSLEDQNQTPAHGVKYLDATDQDQLLLSLNQNWPTARSFGVAHFGQLKTRLSRETRSKYQFGLDEVLGDYLAKRHAFLHNAGVLINNASSFYRAFVANKVYVDEFISL